MGLGKDLLKKSVGIGFVKDVKQGSQAAKAGAAMLADKDQLLAQAAELRAASQAAPRAPRPRLCRDRGLPRAQRLKRRRTARR